ncbi:hypothetical protein EJB05_17552, partial [Eragrostis curvula]
AAYKKSRGRQSREARRSPLPASVSSAQEKPAQPHRRSSVLAAASASSIHVSRAPRCAARAYGLGLQSLTTTKEGGCGPVAFPVPETQRSIALHCKQQQQQQQRRRHEAVTAVGGRRDGGGGDEGGAMSASRRGRFDHHDDDGGGRAGPLATAPVVDQADCTAQSCRSCVAVTLADAIALGCCPCAVVSLLGLAFVKAPLAVARRCLRRLRRRRGELRHKKRVRDMDPAGAAAKCRRRGLPDADAWKGEVVVLEDAAARRASSSSSGRLDAEKVWMEMYRVGQWGFGRLSVSVTPPPARSAGHVAAARGSDGDGGRKDVDLRCES